MIQTEHIKRPGKFYPSFVSLAEAKNISHTKTGMPSVDFNIWGLSKILGKDYIEIGDVRLYSSSSKVKAGYNQYTEYFYWFTCANDDHQKTYSTRCMYSQSRNSQAMVTFATKHDMIKVYDDQDVLSCINIGKLTIFKGKDGKPVQSKYSYETSDILERTLNQNRGSWNSKFVIVRNKPELIAAMNLYLEEIANAKSHLRYSFKVQQAKALDVDIKDVAAATRKINAMRRSINRTNAIEKHYDTLRHTKEHLDDFMNKFVDSDQAYEYKDIKKVIEQFDKAKKALKAVGSAGKL